MANKKVVLIEFIDEANCLITYCDKHKIDINSILIITLSTKVQAYLNSKNIFYSTTLEYFKNINQENIIRKNEEIISYFSENLPYPLFLKEDFIFYSRLYIYHYLWLIEILNNLYEKGLNSLIIIKTQFNINKSLIINECERYIPILCQKFCIEKKIEYEIIDNETPFLCNNVKINKILLKTCEYIAKMNLNNISKSNSPIIVINSLSYNFDKLVSYISNKHPNIKCIIVGETAISLKLLIALILQLFNILPKANLIYLPINTFAYNNEPDSFLITINKIFDKTLFNYKNVSFKEELQEKIKVALIPYLIKLNSQKEILDLILKNTKPKLSLSQIGVGFGRVIGMCSINQNVPSIFISHGSHKTPTNEMEYIELFNLCKGFMLSEFSYAAISSPFAKKHFDYFKLHYHKMSAQPLITGPLIYSKTDSHKNSNIYNKKNGEKIILHATTLKTRGTDRFYFLETNDEFFSAVNDLIDIVNEMDNVKLLVRFHPGYQLSEKEIRSLLKPSEKLLISLSGSFQDVLAISDVLISYSSTTIEEALLNFIPVVLYDKWNRYNHLDASEFKETDKVNCSYYATNRVNLKKCIELLLQNRDNINKNTYYNYIYKEDYNHNFYDFVSKLILEDKNET